MARSVAIAIGVSAPNHLTPLPGVKTGVGEFISWAQSQQFELLQFLDFQGSAVLANDVYTKTDQAIRTRDVQRLFIFFAGHGVTLGQGRDFWLLSDVVDNPNEAINVPLSVQHARRAGIPHVAFFADACRSPAGKNELDLSGQSMFPAMRVDGLSHIDQFYATRSGDPSVEKVPDLDARRAFGVFTRCLMRGLRGEETLAVSNVSGGLHSRAVLSVSLRDYLEESVPLLASEEADVTQIPECTPVSRWTPDVLAWVVGPAPSDESSDQAVPANASPGSPVREGFGPGGRPFPTSPTRPVDARIRGYQLHQLDSIAAGYASPVPRSRLGGRAGLVVVGSEVDDSKLSLQRLSANRQDGFTFVVCDSSRPSALLPLNVHEHTDYFWAGVASFPDHVGTITATHNGVIHVEYQPAMISDLDRESLHDLLSSAGAQAQLASLGRSEQPELFSRVLFEHLNPTLAVLAAYHYNRQGRKDKIKDLLDRYIRRHHPIPFDLLMMADLNDIPTIPGGALSMWTGAARPRFPMMTAGWALLDAVEGYPVAELIEARKYLTPASWTSFSAKLPSELQKVLTRSHDNSRRNR